MDLRFRRRCTFATLGLTTSWQTAQSNAANLLLTRALIFRGSKQELNLCSSQTRGCRVSIWQLPEYGGGYGTGASEQIDLVMTNTTEYRSWDSNRNGVKLVDPENPGIPVPADGTHRSTSGFLVINLLGPRYQAGSWSSTFTVDQYRGSQPGTERTASSVQQALNITADSYALPACPHACHRLVSSSTNL